MKLKLDLEFTCADCAYTYIKLRALKLPNHRDIKINKNLFKIGIYDDNSKFIGFF